MSDLENLTEDQRNSLALKRLFSHPEVGAKAKRLYKEITPDARFQDLEIEDRMEAQRREHEKEIQALRDEAQMREITERREANHKMIRESGLNPVDVEKVMTDEKIADYGTAVKYIRAQNAMKQPTPASVTPIQMPEGFKDIQKNPNKWAREAAHEALNEVISKRAY